MSSYVQHPPGTAHLARIKLGVEDFLFHTCGTGDKDALGIDDGAVADVDPFFRFAIIFLLERIRVGYVVFTHGDAAAQDVDTAFFGDVAQGREPGLPAIPRGGNVDLRAPGIHGVARQRHVILPADEAANFAQRRVVYL